VRCKADVDYSNGCSAAIDEKKATKLSVDRFTSLRLVTTIDILAHDTVQSTLGRTALAEAAFQALRLARMQVQEHQFDWLHDLIGAENVAASTSLRRLANRRKELVRGHSGIRVLLNPTE
jgi:hypothetical protein